jgi:hypothetical protein
MRAQTEERNPTATIPVSVAKRFLADLASAGGGLSAQVAGRLQSQVSVAQLSGADEIDVEAAIVEALVRSVDEPAPHIPLPSHRSHVTPPVDDHHDAAPEPTEDSVEDSDEDSVEDSIDHLIDLVIDLR